MEVIVGGAPLNQTLTNIALVTERILQSALCSIHLLDPKSQVLRHTAAPSLPSAFSQSIDAIEIGPDNGPIAVAAHRREAVTVADVDVDPLCGHFRQFTRQYGLRAFTIQPIQNSQKELLGTLTVYHAKPPDPLVGEDRIVGLVASFVNFAINIEQHERSRRFADERFSSLAATIPGVVYQRRVSPDGDIRYTYISEASKDLFGVSPEEILADPQALFACHGPEYRASFRERLLKASRELTMWDVEAQIIARDGEEKWTHAIARPHREPDGSVLWDGVILDATRIKKAELEQRKAKDAAEASNRAHKELLEMLRSANERFASLATSIPGVVYQRRVSPDGDIRYTYISEASKDLFGVSPEEILADPQALFVCHGPEYRATFRERLLKASRELTMWDVEAQIIARDGEEKWTHAIARPHREPDGSVLWDGVILDATRIKKAELEQRKAKNAAEASNRAKSEFLAAMSHELRTPLNAIIGFSEIIKNETFGPVGNLKYRDYSCDIYESGQQLLGLINDILDLSKIESGADKLHEDMIEIPEIVRAALILVGQRAEQGGIEIKLERPDRLPVLRADERKLKQILVNLLSNAVKFTDPGSVVTLRVWCRMDSGYVFQIVDTGIGIASDDIPKALSQFGQVESDLNRRYEGTGLGLPLTKALVEMHGGALDLQSEVGVGTTVTVRFPATRIVASPAKMETLDEANRAAS